MASESKKVKDNLLSIVKAFTDEAIKIRGIYENAADATVKESALKGMANLMQLQQLGISNYINWAHCMREEHKANK